jgi:ribonuclease HI
VSKRGPVTIFADGSAWEGEGGVGVVLIGPRSVLRIAQYIQPARVAPFEVTNQVAELLAATIGLRELRRPARVRLYSDSAYLINCFRQDGIENWRRKNWRKSGGGEVAHRYLWETLEGQAALHEVEWIHMRGHGRSSEAPALVRWNAITDNLAHTARVERRSWERRTER